MDFIPSKCIKCNKENKTMGENCELYRRCFGSKYLFINRTNRYVDTKFTYVESQKE